MPGTPFSPFTATYVVLPSDNVDTDQIIPARFLKTTERSGLGDAAFADWRRRADGTRDPAFPLNAPCAEGAAVLVAGRNFGCGSSREHAVWALLSAGFRAVVSAEFADIFRSNALGNGLLPIQVSPETIGRLMRATSESAEPRVSVDLATQTITLPDGEAVAFPVAPFAKHCLLHGIDELDFLLGVDGETTAYEANHPPRITTTAGAPEVAA
jgi:3-isopropylmalate/(R)-2-methylmalate dehydratase small subunit